MAATPVRDVKAIVLACNTSSAIALPNLRLRYDIPLLGVVRPGATAAALATRNRRVGVIATQATVRSHSVEVHPEFTLTFVEFELLRALAAQPGRVFSRRMLLEALWKSADYRDPRTIDVHVRHLREKLEAEPRTPEYILTVRGVGYRFRDR